MTGTRHLSARNVHITCRPHHRIWRKKNNVIKKSIRLIRRTDSSATVYAAFVRTIIKTQTMRAEQDPSRCFNTGTWEIKILYVVDSFLLLRSQALDARTGILKKEKWLSKVFFTSFCPRLHFHLRWISVSSNGHFLYLLREKLLIL